MKTSAMRPTFGTALLCLLVAVAISAQTAEATPLQSGQIYQEGTRLDCASAGISFSIPAGFRGGYDPTAKAVLLGSADGPLLLGIYGFSEAGLEEMADVVHGLIQEQGIQLVPLEQEQPDERTARGLYQAMTPEGPGMLVGVIRTGPSGNAIAIAALGTAGATPGTPGAMPENDGGESEAERLRDKLYGAADQVLQSVEFSKPAAQAWRQLLAGRVLTTTGSNSEYSPGGAGGGGSYASGSNTQIDFCSDGTYAYYTKTESYMSIEGMSSESISEDSHAGRWWLVADIAGAATLVLEATDGRVFYWSALETEQGASLEGETYFVGASSRCR